MAHGRRVENGARQVDVTRSGSILPEAEERHRREPAEVSLVGSSDAVRAFTSGETSPTRCSVGRSSASIQRATSCMVLLLPPATASMPFLLGLRQGSAGRVTFARQTSWGHEGWFDDATAVLARVAEALSQRPGAERRRRRMRQKDLQDAPWNQRGDRTQAHRSWSPDQSRALPADRTCEPSDGTSWVHNDGAPPYAVIAAM